MNKILIADDEKEIRDILELLLVGEGYEVTLAENGEQVLQLIDESIDLLILDVNMPGKGGYATVAEIRKSCLAPIIFLTAFTKDSDKAMGFAVGADDYITKPFSNTELILRVKSLLRRTQTYQRQITVKREQKEKVSAKKLQVADINIDLGCQTVTRGDSVIMFTYTEFQILALLASNPKKIFSLENIYQSVWAEDAVGDGTIMVHIKNIRKKLGDNPKNPKYIKTAWGKGYYID